MKVVEDNNESGIMWKEVELNLRKYSRGEPRRSLRISGNEADIRTGDFFSTKCQLDRDSWSEIQVSG
jgi:hypothetical protein